MTGLILTGATGCLGGLIAARARAEGLPVVTIGRDAVHKSDGIKAHDGSAESIAHALGPHPNYTLVHCAAFNSPADRLEDAERLIAGNIGFGFSALRAAQAMQVRHLINFGSFWQYGPDGADHPVNTYAALKTAFQVLLDYSASADELSAITLILSDTYAEYDPRPKLFSLLKDAGQSGAPLPMSDGTQNIAPLHLDDVLDAVWAALTALTDPAHQGRHHRYFATGPELLNIRELVGLFETLQGQPIDAIWGARPKLSRIPDEPYVNGPRLPGWTPQISVQDGIRRILES